MRRKKGARLLTSHESRRILIRGIRNYPRPCLEYPIQHERFARERLDTSLLLFSLPRVEQPMILVNLAPSRVVDRETDREREEEWEGREWQRNIDTVKFNGLIYDRHKSSVTSRATLHTGWSSLPSRATLLSSLPPIFTTLVSHFFMGWIINGEN